MTHTFELAVTGFNGCMFVFAWCRCAADVLGLQEAEKTQVDFFRAAFPGLTLVGVGRYHLPVCTIFILQPKVEAAL